MKLNKIAPSSITFKVISYTEDKEPHSVERLFDAEVFTIGDYVTNGTKMQGKILHFDLYAGEGSDKLQMFVTTDWSNVGMGLDDLQKTSPLPSLHQIGHNVFLEMDELIRIKSEVLAVHFYEGKVKYDLELKLKNKSVTRIYNIDSFFVSSPNK